MSLPTQTAFVFRSPLHRAVYRVTCWCERNLGSRAPRRLIDPDGEGVYVLGSDHSWESGLMYLAGELLGDGRRWRDLDYEGIWMREGEDGNWRRSAWHARDAFKFPRWQPAYYAYITPKADSQ